MVRHYSIKDFFRQMPNARLARYFTMARAFQRPGPRGHEGGRPDELFSAWLYLAEEQRNTMDPEFRGIFELGCE